MTSLAPLPQGISIQDLMRMGSLEILITYGTEVHALVTQLQSSGIVPRDGRSNEDLRLQSEARAQIALQGDCGVADFYKAELEAKK